jgi:energy-coupling factor transport system ATP-binding protein
MGRNGSGKSSLLWALQGSGRRQGGRVQVDGHDPQARGTVGARRLVGMVPQTPADLLNRDTVAAELDQAGHDASSLAVGPVPTVGGPTARDILDGLAPGIADDGHPRDLSEGQRLALVLAVQLSASPPVLFLDEPTRGLDYAAKEALSRILADLAAAGRAVVVSTHDVEFVAGAADRVVVMAEGEIVADGDTTEVIVASPAFAPQVAKVLAPLPYLTVDQVARSLHLVRS